MLRDSSDMKYPRIIKCRGTERRRGVTRDCEEEEIGSRLMGVSFGDVSGDGCKTK